jgi:hypothetical protein
MTMKISSIYDVGSCWHGYNRLGKGRHTRKKGNVSYQYATLYSRTTPIARYHKNAKGELFTLVQSRQYSISTQQQISKCIRWGDVQEIPTFHVPNIGAQGGWSSEKWLEPTLMHEVNLHHLVSLIDQFEVAAIKGWKSTRYWLSDDHWRQSLNDKYNTVLRYAHVTGIKIEMRSLGSYHALVEQGRAKAREAYQQPSAVAKRERARVRRMARKVLGI